MICDICDKYELQPIAKVMIFLIMRMMTKMIRKITLASRAPTYCNGDDFLDNEDDEKDDQKDHLGILAANDSASTPFSTLATSKSFKAKLNIFQ